MAKYKLYESIRGNYVIQNTKTLELELIDEKTYLEGVELNLIEDYCLNLKSGLTRLLCMKSTDDYVFFKTKDYSIVYDSTFNMFNIMVEDKYKRDSILVYLPSLPVFYSFKYCYIKNIQVIGYIKDKDISKLFMHCDTIEYLDLSLLDTTEVVYMKGMFSGCSNLKKIDLTDLKTENVTSMNGMFENCESLVEIDVSSFNTKKVTDMTKMFYNCINLKHLDVSSFDTSNVLIMRLLFHSCINLSELNLKNFNTSNCKDMKQMFTACKSITSLDLSNFDTSKVINMDSMFANCDKLENVDISSFDTSNVIDMRNMFAYCQNLKSIDISNFDLSNVSSMHDIFYKCIRLMYLNISSFKADITHATFAYLGVIFVNSDIKIVLPEGVSTKGLKGMNKRILKNIIFRRIIK